MNGNEVRPNLLDGSADLGSPRLDAASRDPHQWRATIVLTLILITGALAWTMWLNPLIKHASGWIISGDSWSPLAAGRYVSAGAYPYVYEPDGTWVAGPLLPVLLAPIAAIQDALKLTSRVTSGIPVSAERGLIGVTDVRYPSVWVVYASYTMVLSGIFLVAARGAVWDLLARNDSSDPGRLPSAVQVVLTALGLSVAVAYWMHAEDVLGLAMLLFGLRAMWKGRWTATAVFGGLAIGFKQWTVLPALLMVARVPRSDRRKALLVGLGIPGVLYGIPLVAAPGSTTTALMRAQSTPWLGHAAPWITDPTIRRFVAATPGRVAWLAVAVGLAWFVRTRDEPEAVLAAAALILAARLATESVVYSYYLFGVITFIALLEVVQRRSVLHTTIAGAAALAWFWVPPPRVWWWFVELALLSVLVWPAVRTVFRARRQDEPVATDGATSRASEAAVPTSQALAIPSKTA